MFKKTICSILCLMMLISVVPSALASKVSDQDDAQSKVEAEISKINSAHKNAQVSLLSEEDVDNVINPGNPIKLNSLEELGDLVNKISFSSDDAISEQVFIPTQDNATKSNALQSSSSVLNGSWTQSWRAAAWWNYALLTWETLINKNLKADYTYNASGRWYFVTAKNAASWISGTTVARSWTQQGDATMNIRTTNYYHDTLSVSVTGIYILGVSVEVNGVTFPVGLSSTQTWNKDFIFK